MADLLIRKARPGEGEVLGGLGFESWARSIFGEADAGRVDRGRLIGEFVGFARNKPETILVAEIDGQPAGWGAREDRDHRISDLWVAPRRQGRGVGSALLTALETEIREAGHAVAELETLAANQRAIDFYQKHGFRIVWHAEKLSPALGYVIDKVGLNKSL